MRKNETKRKIIMCVNELSYSGVPVYTKHLCQMLDEYVFCVWSLLDGEYRAEFEKMGISVEIFEDIYEAEQRIKSTREEYSACIVHSAYSFEYYEIMKRYLPTVWYIHEGKLLQKLCNLWEELRVLLRTAPSLVCVSEYAADIIRKVSGRTGVRVINNIAFLAEQEEYRPKRYGEKIRFAQIGTIEYRKGWDILLSAIEMFEEAERSKFDVFLAGRVSGDEEDYAKEMLERVRRLENVKYLGYLQGEERVRSLYRDTDVLIAASRDEASSLCALEAASYGIPVILNDSIGAGYLCEGCCPMLQAGNVDQLYHAMKDIINHKTDLEVMGLGVHENYLKYANRENYVEANRKVIEDMLHQNENKRLITVIVEAKQGGALLFETLRSIMRQRMAEKIQVLCCSPDEDFNAMLSQTIEQFSVKHLPVEISCVDVKECLSSIQGDFFTICEEGTVFGGEYFQEIIKYFDRNDSVWMVVSSLWGEGGKRLMQNIFYEKERMIYCEKNPEIVLERTNSVFYRKDVLAEFGEFDGRWDSDLRNAYYVMMQRKQYGVRGEQRNSAVSYLGEEQSGRNIYTTSRIREVYLRLINSCIVKNKEVLPVVQYLIAQDMRKRLKDRTPLRELVEPEDDIEENKGIIIYVMSYVNDKIIYSLSNLALEQKIFWLRKKYGEQVLTVNDSKKGEIKAGENLLNMMYKPLLCYQFAKLEENCVRLEGYVSFPIPELTGRAAIIFSAGSKRYIADKRNNHFSEMIWGDEIVCERIYFCVQIPLEDCDRLELRCNIQIKGYENIFQCERFIFERFFPVGNRYRKQYYYAHGRMLTFQNMNLMIAKCEREQLRAAEEEYELEIKSKEAEYYRNLYLNWYVEGDSKEHIWLIWDRNNAAGDNGEALFRFLMENPQHNIRCYFIIGALTKDYIRLKKEFSNIVPVGSELHKRLFVQAERLIGSQTDSELWPLDGEIYRDIISTKSFVFLQHGITKNDMSANYARYWQNIQLFVTAAKPEYENIKQTANYGFTDKMVQLLGFPRYDLLEKQRKNYIAVCPTWRRYCVEKAYDGKWALKSDFTLSEYFQFYYQLLTNKKLQEVLEKYNYSVILMQHSIMKEADEYFEEIAHVKTANAKMTYKEIITGAAMLISDYSSIAFDFAYLDKPLIYCQFDRKTFYDTHTYQEGYFDYERDGFGEVVYDAAAAADCVERYLRNGCIVEEEYLERSRCFFGFRDKNNCQRTVDAIRRMED